MTDYSSESSSYIEDSSSSDPMPVSEGITVRYSTTIPERHPRIYAYALKVEVLMAEKGFPDHIFVFQRSTENASGNSIDEFIQIASPLEVEEVPENAPDLINGMPYYRAKEVVLYFRCMEDLNLAKRNIREDIKTLVKTYETLNGEFDLQEIEHYER